MSFIVSRIKRRYLSMSIGHKIRISTLIGILLTAMMVSVYYYARTTVFMQEGNTKNFLELMNQTRVSMDNMFSSIEDTGKSIVLNPTLEKVFFYPRDEQYLLAQQLDDYNYLSRYIAMSAVNESIALVRLYVNNHSIYVREHYRFFHASQAVEKPWYDRALFVSGAPVWSESGEEIVCARAVLRYDLAQSEQGFIEIVLNTNLLSSLLGNVIATTTGNICLADDLGHVVARAGASADAFAAFVVENPQAGQDERSPTTAQDELIIRRKLANNWMLYTSLPYRGIRAQIRQISLEILYICLFALILAFLLVTAFTASLTRRVRRVATFMHTVDIHSDEYALETYDDELTIVETSFNQMLRTARESLRKEKAALQRKKEADFDILQEQINPHFLYNCLDSINWMAIECDAQEISGMTTMLSRFFRLGLSRGNQIIPLQDELEHVRLYLEIMKKRFDGRIDTSFAVEPEARACYTLKFILQPLVENAIAHGISNRVSQEGHILICGVLEDDTLCITVEDDGVGMPPERCEQLMKALQSDAPCEGFGLYNVSQRIRLHFGEAYGLQIESVYQQGTRVVLRLPARITPEQADA